MRGTLWGPTMVGSRSCVTGVEGFTATVPQRFRSPLRWCREKTTLPVQPLRARTLPCSVTVPLLHPTLIRRASSSALRRSASSILSFYLLRSNLRFNSYVIGDAGYSFELFTAEWASFF